ncbi:MAG: SDR family NAD(P)-dependent oxidoreductase [Bacteriovoracaceae bacterium]|nr:SDR family NAD(P)-dependent oxidoreductase [Bacteriovoracaceae bacterium]
MENNNKVALVTGATRGLGLGVAQRLLSQNHTVILTGRNPIRLEQVLIDLKKTSDSKSIFAYELDMTNVDQMEEMIKKIILEHNSIDILINNAGILIEGEERVSNPTQKALPLSKKEIFHKTFETNTIGPFLLAEMILPMMKKNGFGRIVNVSSGMGSLESMGNDWPAYRSSKTALNAVTRILASQINPKAEDILINSVCPGWVRTDMGGKNAPRALDRGVDSIVWGALLPKDGPNGGFFRDGKPIRF